MGGTRTDGLALSRLARVGVDAEEASAGDFKILVEQSSPHDRSFEPAARKLSQRTNPRV